MTNPFYVSGYEYPTLDEAIKAASRRAATSTRDVTVYQAIKLVAPKTPDVVITDITIPA